MLDLSRNELYPCFTLLSPYYKYVSGGANHLSGESHVNHLLGAPGTLGHGRCVACYSKIYCEVRGPKRRSCVSYLISTTTPLVFLQFGDVTLFDFSVSLHLAIRTIRSII